MRILYDHQIFTNQEVGGISRYYTEIFFEILSNQKNSFELASIFTNNYYLSKLNNGKYSFMLLSDGKYISVDTPAKTALIFCRGGSLKQMIENSHVYEN